MLDHIVSKLVIHQVAYVSQYLFQYRSGLLFLTILEDPLNDSTSISVNA
jgi:hypothetical protein